MTALDFWSIISLMGIAQALLLIVLFAFDKRKYSLPNLLIILLLFWIIWLQAEFLVVRRSFIIQSSFLFGSRHGVWLLLGPLMYHYVLSLFHKIERFRINTWLHYLPFVLFVLILPLTGNIHTPDRIINYGMLSVLKFPALANSWLDTLYGYIFILQFIHASVYLILTFGIINKVQKDSLASSSDNRLHTLQYLKGLIGMMILSMFSSVIFIGVLLRSRWYVREMDYIYILPLTLCAYFFSYFTMRLPLLFEKKEPIPEKYNQSGLDKEVSRRQFEDLKSIIQREKLYLNPELRLSDLSAASGVSYHQLSEVINREGGISFFEFINQFRVDEVLNVIDDKSKQGQRINILEIAYAAGFNNKVSFNRYFKKKTGKTPTDFIKNDLKRG